VGFEGNANDEYSAMTEKMGGDQFQPFLGISAADYPATEHESLARHQANSRSGKTSYKPRALRASFFAALIILNFIFLALGVVSSYASGNGKEENTDTWVKEIQAAFKPSTKLRPLLKG